jgi:hypothetical protein
MGSSDQRGKEASLNRKDVIAIGMVSLFLVVFFLIPFLPYASCGVCWPSGEIVSPSYAVFQCGTVIYSPMGGHSVGTGPKWVC